MRPRLKVCCISSPAEADMAARHGADLLGLVGPMPSGPGTLSLARAAEIVKAVASRATPVLLTSQVDADGILRDVQSTGVDTVQIVNHVSGDVHRDLRDRAPDLRRIQVVHVEDARALEMLERYGDGVDMYLLDSGRPSLAELGGTGRVHDWAISAAFIADAPVPVFLAGGLTPDNVADALARTRPFGIDLCSGVRTDEHLDLAKLSAFVAAMESAQ